jgi:HD-like signal output (HDOD) protein
MEKVHLLDRIESSRDLLSIPQILGEILEAIETENTSPETIASIILRDASLTAKVLRMANSSYYNRSMPISTVQQGVRVLGVNAVKCVALSVSIFSKPKAEEFGDFDIRTIYFHLLGVGIVSRAIAERHGGVNNEEAFVIGLLHDLGELFIMNACPKQFVEIQTRVQEGEDIIELERQYFDVDHAELGGVIAARWRLPKAFQEVMRGHHFRDPGDDLLVLVVKLADLITSTIYSTNIKRVEKHLEEINHLAELLDLDREFLNSLTFVLMEETIKAAGHIGVDIGDTTDLLNRANRELCNAYLMIESMFRERQELSAKLLAEERTEGMIRSMNIAIATLSHYLNNIATAISGRVQLLQMGLDLGDLVDKSGKVSVALDVIDSSIAKMLAVLTELKSLTRLEGHDFYSNSDALNIDQRIRERLQALADTPVGTQ